MRDYISCWMREGFCSCSSILIEFSESYLIIVMVIKSTLHHKWIGYKLMTIKIITPSCDPRCWQPCKFSTNTGRPSSHSKICWPSSLAGVCWWVWSSSFPCCGDGGGPCYDDSRYSILTVLPSSCKNLSYFALILIFSSTPLGAFSITIVS